MIRNYFTYIEEDLNIKLKVGDRVELSDDYREALSTYYTDKDIEEFYLIGTIKEIRKIGKMEEIKVVWDGMEDIIKRYDSECLELYDDKKRIKKRMPDIDPFDEENWGYVQESVDDGFKIDDRVKSNDDKYGTGTIIDLEHMNINYYGIEFDRRIRGGHDCNGHGKIGHCFYLPTGDFLKIEDGIKKKRIRRPDIDPFDEEDWGYVQESIVSKAPYWEKTTFKVGDIVKLRGDSQYSSYQSKNVGKIVGFIYDNSDHSHVVEWEPGHRRYYRSQDLELVGNGTRIRRPDIDPFDEEDWGYVQESVDFGDFEVGDRVEYAGRPGTINKFAPISSRYGCVILDMDEGGKVTVPPNELKKLNDKRIKKRRPDIDPFNEEDWGFEEINEISSDVGGIRLDFDKLIKDIGMEELLRFLNNHCVNKKVYYESRSGEIYKDHGHCYTTRRFSERNNDVEVELGVTSGRPKALIFFDYIPNIYNEKKRLKIRRPDIDPFDEEDWGYEEIDENFINKEDLKVGDTIFYKKSSNFAERGEPFTVVVFGKNFVRLRGQGNDDLALFDFSTDAVLKKFETGKKRTKIKRPDIDPFDEEDWGYED